MHQRKFFIFSNTLAVNIKSKKLQIKITLLYYMGFLKNSDGLINFITNMYRYNILFDNYYRHEQKWNFA